MNINFNDNINFQARVSPKLKKDIFYYCKQKSLPVEANKFDRKLKEIGNYGDKNSVFKVVSENIDEKIKKSLIFVNQDINSKSGLIVFESFYFGDIIRFFNKLTKDAILEYEKMLKNDL